ncbi:MAG: Ldh family oxidoreductase, partial [Chloroflexi bacterium]|nr:Ldh family oxidoreductase [Chloroflexota bacterium]
MLERFHVPSDIAVHVAPDDMHATVTDIFLKMGMSADDANQAAEVLVYADIRGIETHGVSNMLRRYVESFGEGRINPTPNPKIIREMPAAATLDSDRGHGLVIGPLAMNMAIERAKIYGIGTITA